MPKQTLQQFGQTVKAKHPEYSDLGDEELAQKVLAKYPQYADMVDAASGRPAGATPGPIAAPAVRAPAPEMTPDVASNGSQTGGSRLSAAAYNFGGHSVDAARATIDSLLHPVKALETYPGSSNAVFAQGEQAAADRKMLRRDPVRLAETAAGDLAGSAAVGEAVGGIVRLPGAAKRAVTAAADEVTPGAATTPRQNYEAAKRLGVNLDAADATGSSFFKGVKKLNEHSLLGGSTYERARGNNLAALNGATESTLDAMSPLDRESGGKLLQERLKQNQQNLQQTATEGFDRLSKETGDQPIPGAADVGSYAADVSKRNEPYYGQFPSLKPTKAMNVVDDVAGGLSAKKPQAPVMSKLVDERGQPIPSSIQPPAPKSPSWGTLQRVRSDVQDVYRNNPDIVQNQGGGWLQQIAAKTDEAMTSGTGTLTPEQLQTFRDANASWKDMKGTYDDPSSPLYSAVRTQNVSNLPTSVMGRTPEQVRNVSGRVGPEGIGVAQRGVADKALGTTNDGQYNFKSFGTQWNRLPEDFRSELYGPQADKLNDIANTGVVLTRDFNPSGTAKMTQKMAEGAALFSAPVHPFAAIEPIAQYPVAKAMNSPKVVDFLMKPPKQSSGKPSPFGTFVRGATYGSGPISRAVLSGQ